MSVLVVQIPARRRLGSGTAGGEDTSTAGASARTEYTWVRTLDGLSVTAQGRCVAALLPPSDAVVAVVAHTDVSWQRIPLPKAPAAKLRAALGGMVEDFLLDEPDALHLALSPDAVPGSPTWIAVTDKAWLQTEIQVLERGGALVDRVVPMLWPGDAPQGHFFDAAAEGAAPEPAIAMADSHGIVCLPLAGSLARAMLPLTAAQTLRWSAPPAVAAAAELWLGAPVDVQSPAQRLLMAARSVWNLRQFELEPRRRGTRMLRDAMRRWMSPGWRPTRIGLVSLVMLQIVGLNAWAWAQRQAIDRKRSAQTELLAQTHPQVRSVIDAPLQMARETDLLRTSAGLPGATDLEPMLAAAAAAWPDSQGPAQSLRFQLGQLTLATGGWSDNDVRQFADRLRPGGWSVEPGPGRVVLSRSTASTTP